MKKTSIIYFFLLSLAAAGFLLKGFFGGFLCGLSLCFLLLFMLGKRSLEKASQKIDKAIKDRISNID